GPSPASLFRDYVALEQESIQRVEEEQFWLRTLEGVNATRVPRLSPIQQPVTRKEFKALNSRIPEHLSVGLKEFAEKSNTSLKTVLVALHMKVLGLISGEVDVVTGLATNGRLEELDGERTLGLFLNTLPFRVKLPTGSWADLIKQVFESEKEMFGY